MGSYNFNDEFRKALERAREEARQLNHEYVGGEHMLLALLRETDSVAAQVLKSFAVDVSQTREVLLGVLHKGTSASFGADLPYTSRGKRTLELAMIQSREWEHSHTGPEHLPIGLLREKNGIAGEVLVNAGVTLDAARAQTLSILGVPPTRSSWRTSLKRIFS